MNYSNRLITELKQEAESTRRVLERVPPDKLSWKPHEKSMSLGQLALHTAGVPGGLAEFLDEHSREVPIVPLPEATSLNEILSTFDKYRYRPFTVQAPTRINLNLFWFGWIRSDG